MAIPGQGSTIVAVVWLETAVAFIAIAFRIYTRKFITRNFMLMPYAVGCTVAATQGFGQHSVDLTSKAFASATRSEIIGQTFCIIGAATSKAPVLGVSAAEDFVLAALPWIILWNLNMPKKDKILITSSMSLGILTVNLGGLSSRSDYSYETIATSLSIDEHNCRHSDQGILGPGNERSVSDCLICQCLSHKNTSNRIDKGIGIERVKFAEDSLEKLRDDAKKEGQETVQLFNTTETRS
ncbi:hypothetical protein NHQ30_000610 [Ciborinia camelliae]|nr:hypothetical protein NHQ30_000610 [Ciborinia camelliae]